MSLFAAAVAACTFAGCAVDAGAGGVVAGEDPAATSSTASALSGQWLDIQSWCTATHNPSWVAVSSTDPTGWLCDGAPVDLTDVCRWQYGANAFAVKGNPANASNWTCSTVAQGDYSDANGWSWAQYGETVRFADIDGDGNTDVCGRGSAGVYCATYAGDRRFTGSTLWSGAYSDGAGWGNLTYATSIQLVDVTGDGKADLCARGAAGVVCSISNGRSFVGSTLWSPVFSDANGWANGPYSIAFGDVNGDGRADVCGRGYAGVSCGLSTGGAFASPTLWESYFGDPEGYGLSPYARSFRVGDVDDDGVADVCARGAAGVFCETSTRSAFTNATLVVDNFSDAHGWNASAYGDTIRLVPPAGTHDARICGRGAAGVYCAERQAGPSLAYGSVTLASSVFSDAHGWNSSPSYYDSIGFGRFSVPDSVRPVDVTCGRENDGITCDATPEPLAATVRVGTPEEVDYSGGPLMTGRTSIYFIFYGTWTAADEDTLVTFAKNVGGSAYADILGTYHDSHGVSPRPDIVYGGSWNAGYARGPGLNDSWPDEDGAALVDMAQNGGHLPADPNGIYVIASSIDVAYQSESNTGKPFGDGWCEYHKSHGVYDYVMSPRPKPTAQGCGWAARFPITPNDPGIDGMISAMAHEIFESITDGFGGGYNGPHGENGDVCAWDQGITAKLPNGAAWNLEVGGRHYLVQRQLDMYGGNQSNYGTCEMSHFEGGIGVQAATYGDNCATPGNETAAVAAACNGLSSCWYVVDFHKLGDPAPGCAKEFRVSWSCNDGPHEVVAPPEAGFGKVVHLACN